MNKISGFRPQHQSNLQFLVIIIGHKAFYLLGEYTRFNKYHIKLYVNGVDCQEEFFVSYPKKYP